MQKLVGVLACAGCVILASGLAGCPKQKDAAAKVVQMSVVDFEGLPAGTIVSSLSSGAGITGPLIGSVAVNGVTPSLAPANTAVIFDSANPTGGDPDLGTPNELFGGPGESADGSGPSNMTALGKILILAEDLVDNDAPIGLVDDPDDTFENDSHFTFDFSGVSGAVVNVLDMTVLDVEENEGGAFVQVSGPTLPPTNIPIPFTGDNGAATFPINAEGVNFMLVTFNGSGAVGEFKIEQEVRKDGGFRTQTQGGWGTRCRGRNPGCYRDEHFDDCFEEGLMVGCEPGKSILLTSSTAIENLLPEGGTPAALTQDHVNPMDLGNVLVGQVVALTLNVGFDLCDSDFGESNTNLADLVVIDEDSECFGMTVEEVLELANAILGGCSDTLTPSQINDCVSKINENYVDGNTDNGFLG